MKSRLRLAVTAGLVLVACGDGDGGEDAGAGGEDGGTDGGAVDCAAATDGTECGGGDICVGGACGPSACGDGYIDAAGGEECEDGNSVAFDGCEPDSCTFTCAASAGCDDGDPCNGAETCDLASHTCAAGTGLGDGTECGATQICVGAVCVTSACGDSLADPRTEECDDGNRDDGDGCEADCSFTCDAIDDPACDDGDPCTGAETCDLAAHQCRAGAPLGDGLICMTAEIGDGICRGGQCVNAGCGNSVVEAGEQCDDGQDGDDADGCTDACTYSCPLWPGETNWLGSVHGGFEPGTSYMITTPITFGPNPPQSLWFGDGASLLTAEMGLSPSEGTQMLRFDSTTGAGAGGTSAAEVRFMLVAPSEWAGMFSTGRVRVHMSAHFNRVNVPDADTHFDIKLHAQSAHPDDGGTQLATARSDLTSDSDLDSWQCVRLDYLVPAGTTMFLLQLAASENVQNDSTFPEFDGHYADGVAVWFTLDP